MTVVDFIDLIDDDINIIDLTNNDDTVQEDHIATQHQATALLDWQGMFGLAGSQGVQAVFVAATEGSQDVQAVFAEASEGTQEAASSMVAEKAALVAASEGSQDVQAVFVAASERRQEAAEFGHALEATTSSMVAEKAPLVAASEGSQDVQAVFVAASERRQEAVEFGHALEATTLSMVTEKAPLAAVVLALQHAGSPNCPCSPTSATFASPVCTTPKMLTSEGGDGKLVRAKRKWRKKNYHTDTPRRSPRFEQNRERAVEEPADDHKRCCTLEPAEESAASTNKEESATKPANEPVLTYVAVVPLMGL